MNVVSAEDLCGVSDSFRGMINTEQKDCTEPDRLEEGFTLSPAPSSATEIECLPLKADRSFLEEL